MSGLCGRDTHALMGGLRVVLRWKLDAAAKVLVAGYLVIIRVQWRVLVCALGYNQALGCMGIGQSQNAVVM